MWTSDLFNWHSALQGRSPTMCGLANLSIAAGYELAQNVLASISSGTLSFAEMKGPPWAGRCETIGG